MITAAGEELFLRPADSRHHNYIYSTCVREACAIIKGRGLPKRLVADGIEHIMSGLMDHVQVATTENSPATAHAWICAVRGALMFVYVPHELRRQGIAKHLVREVCGCD